MLNQSDYTLQKWIEKNGGSVSLVFTDIVASTSLLSKVGTVMYTDFRKAHRDHANQLRQTFGGVLIDQTGDSLFLAFNKLIKAYAFAVGIFENPGHKNIKVRIGVHFGKVTADGNALLGKAVHYAARVMQNGMGAELWLSDAAKQSFEEESPDLVSSINWLKTEEYVFKGFEGKQRLWRAA
jgi:class 3 adenylate cyclase